MYFKIPHFFLDVSLFSLFCRSNDKKITDPVEEDFIYGGMILEEMEEEHTVNFKNIIMKYGMNTTIEPEIKKQIKDVTF